MKADIKQKEKMKIWYRENSEYVKKRTRKWSEDNHSKVLFMSCKLRAKKFGIMFTITEEDIVIPPLCPLLKLPLTSIQGQGKVDTNASVDRIDSTKGYTKDNIWVISHLANRMKNSASPEQLVIFAKSIMEIYEN